LLILFYFFIIDEEIANKKLCEQSKQKAGNTYISKEIKKVTVKNVDYLDKYLNEL
jgi:hypothetical protein